MTIELELPGLFDELADAHRVGSPPPLDLAGTPSTSSDFPSQRRWFAVAGVAAASVGLIAGLIVLTDARGAAPTDSPPAPPTDASPTTTAAIDLSGPVVLAPPPGGGATLRGFHELDLSHTAAGSVLAPDGTVFGIDVAPAGTLFATNVGPSGTVFGVDVEPGDGSWPPDQEWWNEVPSDRRDVAVIAGFEVAAFVDGSAPTQIYRNLRHPCLTVQVSTAGAAMWSDDLTPLLAATTIDDGGLTVELPDGWRSLGGERMLEGWMIDLEVTIDGTEHSVNLIQVPNAPAGYLLAGTETNPVPISHDGAEWWTIDIATTPGRTEVVGPTGAGAVRATSDLTADELLAVIDSLQLTPVDRLDALIQPSVDEPAEPFDVATKVAVPDGCPDVDPDVDPHIDIRDP